MDQVVDCWTRVYGASGPVSSYPLPIFCASAARSLVVGCFSKNCQVSVGSGSTCSSAKAQQLGVAAQLLFPERLTFDFLAAGEQAVEFGLGFAV